MLAQASQQHGAVVMCGRQVRVERNSPFETLQGLPLASDCLKCDTKIRVRSCVLECKTHRLPSVHQRFFASSEYRKRRGTGSVATGKRPIECERAIAGLQRFLFAPERMQRLSEIQQSARAIGLELQGLDQKYDCIRMTSKLGERYAQQLQDMGIVGCTPQQRLVARYRLAQAACTMLAHSGGEALLPGLIGCVHGIRSRSGMRELTPHRKRRANIHKLAKPWPILHHCVDRRGNSR
jgi:hypothetical protein